MLSPQPFKLANKKSGGSYPKNYPLIYKVSLKRYYEIAPRSFFTQLLETLVTDSFLVPEDQSLLRPDDGPKSCQSQKAQVDNQ